MKKKFVTLGIMMALSMTVAAGCGQKAGNETTAQERMGQQVRQQRQHSQMSVISMYPQRRLWRRQKIRVPMCWM